ncbi:Nudix hydrolase 2 [Coccomyxa sp. Obi]|nr:Nudix hydrolase 2 [Coccomyxa sp. Obi]
MVTRGELPVAEVTLLQGQEDRYEGIIVDGDGLPDDPQEFSERLDYSLRVWQEQQRKGIWIKVPISKVGLIEVGVGCFVVNEDNHVLVVQEKNGPLKGRGVWKMVTGLVDAGEDINDAAEREVLEETGVKAKFAAVLALRQAHGFAFGKSDFFFVVALRPEPGQTELVMQEDELEAVAWMPLEDYAAVPFQSSKPILRQILDCCVAYAKGDYLGMTGMKLENGFNDRRDLLIHGEITRKSSL